MADSNNAEERDLLKLGFDISKIEQDLKQIDAKVLETAKRIESQFKNIKLFDISSSGLNMQTNIKRELDKKAELFEQTNEQIRKNEANTQEYIKRKQAETAEYEKRIAEKSKADILKIEAEKNAQIALKETQKNKEIAVAREKHVLEMEKYNQRLLNNEKDVFDKIESYGKTYLIYTAFNELKRASVELVNEMVDVEYRMTEISRIMADGSINVNAYRDQIIQLAYDYGNTFDVASDIVLRFARTGMSAADSLAMTEKALLALNTAELDAEEATEDMIAILSQWNALQGTTSEKSEYLESTIDKINKVADNFSLSSQDLLDALKKTSSGFNIAGATIDETIAMITAAEVASKRGGKAIGTAMSNMAQQLKTEGRLDILEQLGIEAFADAEKTVFLPLTEIFTNMSEKMKELQDSGKGTSVEMQKLMETFTVFRRNIGTGLLSGMSGEDNYYLQALEVSLNSAGYSAQENAKHMGTAKAALAQFNDTLLQLKTTIWDSGTEDFFRSLIKLAEDLTNGIKWLVDNFGLIPTVIGISTLAFSTFNKNIKLVGINSEKTGLELTGFIKKIKDGTEEIKKANLAYKKMADGQMALAEVTNNSRQEIMSNIKSFGKYTTVIVSTTAKTLALEAATIALNTALTLGLSVAITAIISGLDYLIHKEEKFTEKLKENKQILEENAQSLNEEVTALKELSDQYEELSKKENRTPEEEQKIYEIQEQINNLIKDTGTQVELVTKKIDEQGKSVLEINKNYDEQLEKIKAIEYQKKKSEVEGLKEAAEIAKKQVTGTSLGEEDTFWSNLFETSGAKVAKDLEKIGFDVKKYLKEDLGEEFYSLGNDFYNIFDSIFSGMNVEKQIQSLNLWKEELNKASNGNEEYSESIEIIDKALERIEKQYNDAQDAINKYQNALNELFQISGQIDSYSLSLQSIFDSYNIEGPKKLIEELQNLNQQFSDGEINIENYFDKIQEKISKIDLSKEGEELEAYQAIFAATTSSLADGISNLNAGMESGTINFTEYSNGIKEASDNILDLYVKQNELSQDENQNWINNQTGAIDEYANSLDGAINKLSEMGDLLTTIGDNYDYIAENADNAGNAAFKMADIGTEQYQILANSMAQSLNKMKETNNEAYNAIVNKVYEAMNTSANEVVNADTYIMDALNSNSQALNAALNEAANQVSLSTKNVTVSMGNVLSTLGEAISSFSYNIKASPYISGNFKFGINNGKLDIQLPTFGFNISGSGGDSIKSLGSALKSFGSELSGLGEYQFKYNTLKSKINPYVPSSGNTSSSASNNSIGTDSSSGGGSSSSYTKEAEEIEDNRFQIFKEGLEERERLEQRWVDRQKELGQLSLEDEKYITRKRIERYQQYIDTIKKLDYGTEEEKLELQKQYYEDIEDLQVEYIKLQEEILNEEIEKIKKKNEEKIQSIEDAADKEIEALEEVEDTRDRIREKEEYEAKRQELIHGYQGIEYWSQRTGREAQLALEEAKKELDDLDKEWQEKVEDWNTEDQIAAIEEKRDAEIAAIEEVQEAEIAELQAVYDAKVKMFAETGQLIYDESVMQSQALYNSYKENFIDPLAKDLQSALTPKKTETTPSYSNYTIKYGDTLSGIAYRFGTTVSALMEANPYITNKNLIYAGKNLRIPKYHGGGVTGGFGEFDAKLIPNELILNPMWTKKLKRIIDNTSVTQNTFNNGTSINVEGNLVELNAEIKDHADAQYTVKLIEKTLKDKFNIKK